MALVTPAGPPHQPLVVEASAQQLPLLLCTGRNDQQERGGGLLLSLRGTGWQCGSMWEAAAHTPSWAGGMSKGHLWEHPRTRLSAPL